MLAYRSMTDQNCSVEGLGTMPQMPAVSIFPTATARVNPKRKAERNDADLIERLKAGDEQALEAIFNRYSAKL